MEPRFMKTIDTSAMLDTPTGKLAPPTHTGALGRSMSANKFQEVSYPENWCARCRLPIPSSVTICPTCGSSLDTSRSTSNLRAVRKQQRPPSQTRQSKRDGEGERSLRLPPIAQSDSSVSCRAAGLRVAALEVLIFL